MRTLEQVIAALPNKQRAEIDARAQELMSEEIALRHLRQARDLTQKRMADLLNVDQASVSKIERRSDMLLSTLRSYIEAMGGSLRLIAEFPDGAIQLRALSDDAQTETREATKRRYKSGPTQF